MATSSISLTNCLSFFLSAPPPLSSGTQLPPSTSVTLRGRRTTSDGSKLVCFAGYNNNNNNIVGSEPFEDLGRGYNVEVEPYEDESDERLVNRFRREVIQAGVFREIMKRRHYENAREKKKRKTKEAAKRNSMRRRGPYRPRFTKPDEDMEETRKVDVVDSDNWELPEGDDLPY